MQELGITGSLYRTLSTTNPLEKLHGSIADVARNVRRWKDGEMVRRWVASALSDACKRFRKLRGFAEMKTLLKALEQRAPASEFDVSRKVA